MSASGRGATTHSDRWTSSGFAAWVAAAPSEDERGRRALLGGKACQLADDVHDERLTMADALFVLRALCPGFDDGTCRDALGYGLNETK